MTILSIKQIFKSYKDTWDVIPYIILTLLILFILLLITDLSTLKLLEIMDESQEFFIVFKHLWMIYIIQNRRSEINFHFSISINHLI